MHALTDLSLLTGWVPPASVAAAVAGVAWLLLRRDRRYLRRRLPAALLATAVVVVAGWVVVEQVWKPFPDPLPWSVYGWVALGLAGLALLVPRVLAARGWAPRVLTGLAVLLVVVGAAERVNFSFRAYPTVGTALGAGRPEEVDLGRLTTDVSTAVASLPLSTAWTPPPGMPDRGALSQVEIPGTTSGFSARPGWVWVPPAYLASPRAVLPVLVLLAGQPGTTDDWLNGGHLVATMDAWAARHGGLAPVVVLADGTGGPLANPLCLDSRIAQVQTYLAVDVPAWVRGTLQVQDDPRQWAVGGFSYGGTCALQLGTNRPDVYPTFLDVSGQDEPTLGTRRDTVQAAFGGDAAAFSQVNPIDIMARRQFPDSAATIVTGSQDTVYRPQGQRVLTAAQASGMDVRYVELPGSHDYGVWAEGLTVNLDWLGSRLGITP